MSCFIKYATILNGLHNNEIIMQNIYKIYNFEIYIFCVFLYDNQYSVYVRHWRYRLYKLPPPPLTEVRHCTVSCRSRHLRHPFQRSQSRLNLLSLHRIAFRYKCYKISKQSLQPATIRRNLIHIYIGCPLYQGHSKENIATYT